LAAADLFLILNLFTLAETSWSPFLEELELDVSDDEELGRLNLLRVPEKKTMKLKKYI